MPYVDLDGSGKVKGVYANKQFPDQPFVDVADSKVTEYLNPPPGPDRRGFEAALFMAYRFDFVAIENLYKEHPLFLTLLKDENWQAMQAYLITKHTDKLLSDSDYAAIKTAATPNNIPVTLP